MLVTCGAMRCYRPSAISRRHSVVVPSSKKQLLWVCRGCFPGFAKTPTGCLHTILLEYLLGSVLLL